MQTLTERLKKHCEENKQEMPYGAHLNMLGIAISNHLKNTGKYELVQKVKVMEELEVNTFPDELLPQVDEIISRFFIDRFEFIGVVQANRKKTDKPKRFNYQVEGHKATAFENALIRMSIPVNKNEALGSKSGVVQFILIELSPATLITLGKVFQKERQLEKKKYWSQANANAVTEGIEEQFGINQPAEKEKPIKKRTRKPIDKTKPAS